MLIKFFFYDDKLVNNYVQYTMNNEFMKVELQKKAMNIMFY